MNAQSNSIVRRALIYVVLPLLVLCLVYLALSQLQQPAYSRGLTSPPAAEPVSGTPTPTLTPTPCPANPPTGSRVKLRSEDEILVVARHRDDDTRLRNYVLDYNSGLQLSTSVDYNTIDALTHVRKLSITAADLNGDGTYERVSAFRDKSDRIGAISSASGTTGASWYRDGDYYKGDNVTSVDIAAGDLDRSGGDDEVVIAFADDYNAIHVVLLNGAADGKIANAVNTDYGNWTDNRDSTGLGTVYYVAVAVGDLNGDGFDNEIVTVMKDGNRHLHTVILRRNDDGTMTPLLDKYWTNHDRDNVAKSELAYTSYGNRRPIDVTTGDVDGDKRDEAILGFRTGDDQDPRFQLLALKYVNQTYGTRPVDDRFIMDDQVYINSTIGNERPKAVQAISLSAGDLDGDGVDEIAVGLGTMHWETAISPSEAWQPVLKTFAYVPVTDPAWQDCPAHAEGDPPCLFQLAKFTGFGSTQIPAFTEDTNPASDIRVATGELDDDGMEEIVVIRWMHSDGDIRVYAFNADAGLPDPVSFDIGDGGRRFDDFWVAMGDVNGDSRYANYTGVCYSKPELNLVSVIHAPPHGPDEHWADNFEEAASTFGWEKGEGQGSTTGTETLIGGSVKVGTELKGMSSSFTYEWEKSCFVEEAETTTRAEGGKYSTRPPWIYHEEASFASLNVVKTDYACYVYSEPLMGNMDVCIPTFAAETAFPLEWWYKEALEEYPDSWVPLGINLAEGLGTHATQSSVYGSAVASRAVDGNTDGNYAHNSVAHTNSETNAWWEVDLGGVQQIDAIQVWNRTDCCSERLKDFYVFVSEEPFASTDPTQLVNSGVWNHHITADIPAKVTTTVPVNHLGRYVRVQLAGRNNLQLAEVQVWGMPGEPNLWPKNRPTDIDGKTFQITWPGGRTQVVPGELKHTYQGTPKWMAVGSQLSEIGVGFGYEKESIQGESTSNKYSLGMEIRGSGFELTTGTTQKTGHILSWTNEVQFDAETSGPPTGKAAYYYAPYVWMQKSTSSGKVDQQFFVLDYWVPQGAAASEDAFVAQPDSASGPALTPAIPLLNSSTHPDPATWVMTNTATFTWSQPQGDPATIAGYNWQLDGGPGAAPLEQNRGLVTEQTYSGLGDGIWHMHVRAKSDGGEWSETAHRIIRVDANAPKVKLAVEPEWPTGHSGWYITPLTVTVNTTDAFGSGVTAVEVSTDGVTWQPYTSPLAFGADTEGTTVYARATDAVGYTSEPISTTFKIDRTAPDSHVPAGQGPGAWIATVFTNTLGNQEMVLAGAIADDLSGRSGMDLEYDGLDWTSAHFIGSRHPFPGQPQIEVNWYYTATHELGAGNHIFTGRAQDVAGNMEDAYEIARVVRFPQSSPDLGGSSVTASPASVRPGDTVNLVLVARNAGWQEAMVSTTDTLPVGLTPVAGSLASDVQYDASTRTITWPATLLWPGEWNRHNFEAQVDVGTPATTLENQATFHAFWPNTDLLPPGQRQDFLDREQTVSAVAAIVVAPGQSAGADFTPPWVDVTLGTRQVVGGSQVRLGIDAAPDARWMYLREWTPDPSTGAWTVAQSSGWLDYSSVYTWTLSAGQGVKYLGMWVADDTGNVSTLDEHSLGFVNRIDGPQSLADGQRVQYRGFIDYGTWVLAVLKTVVGDPDLYVWRPHNSYRPDGFSNETVDPGQVEDLGTDFVQQSGRFLVDVQAVGASDYELTLNGEARSEPNAVQALVAKERPAHPLSVSDPLSAGQLGPIVGSPLKIYLPVMYMND